MTTGTPYRVKPNSRIRLTGSYQAIVIGPDTQSDAH